MAGEETTLREYGRELGQHDARLDGLEKKIDHMEEKMDEQHGTILGAIQSLNESRARSAGKQQIISAGGGLVAGGVMAWVLKQIGV